MLNDHFFKAIKIVGAGCLMLFSVPSQAQDKGERYFRWEENASRNEYKHALHAEIGGRTFIWGSINYEYKLTKRISVGGGLGIINIQSGLITRQNNGADETGNYLDIATSQMVYGNYFLGRRVHKLYFTGGLTNFLALETNRYPSENEFNADAELQWNAGIGYQLSIKRVFFRLTGYVLSMPQPSAWFPKYMPWVGITYGYRM